MADVVKALALVVKIAPAVAATKMDVGMTPPPKVAQWSNRT